MAFHNTHLFDHNDSTLYYSDAAGTGWLAPFLTAGASITKVSTSGGIWPDGQWVRKHVAVDSGTTRDRSFVSYNTWGNGQDEGSDSGPGDTIWIYEEFFFSAGFSFAGGTWNNVGPNLHQTSGTTGGISQVPFHFVATDVRGQRDLCAQIRGGRSRETDLTAASEPNHEDYLLDSPFKTGHKYRILMRMTWAPNGTVPQRNRFISTNQPGAQIVPLSQGDSHGIVEIWVDDVLKVSKRRPTSYYDLGMYFRSGYDRNGDGTNATSTHWHAKTTVAPTRSGLFALIEPTTTDTFQDGQDSSGGGGEPPPPSGPAVLPAVGAGRVRFGTVNSDGTPPGGRTTMGADRIRASGPVSATGVAVDRIYFHTEASVTGSQVYRVVVWDDNGTGGEPGTRMILSPEVTKTTPFDPVWQSIAISPAVTLPAGSYWLGVHSGATADRITYAYADVSSSYRSAADTYADGSPTTWPGGTTDRYKMAIVLEGIPAGGSTDTVRPAVASATAELSALTMQMDEEIQTSATPTASAFFVRVNGVALSAQSVALGVDTITLGLQNPLVNGDTVTVSYDSSLTSNQVMDLAGNVMISFSEFPVTNETLPVEVNENYNRVVALTRVVDPSKRIVDPSKRLTDRDRPVWT